MYRQFHFVHTAAINATPDRIDVFKDVDIGKCLAGIEKFCIKDGKGRYKFIELFFYFFSMGLTILAVLFLVFSLLTGELVLVGRVRPREA